MKLFAMLFLMALSVVTHADGRKFSATDQPKWKTECGTCHLAFPPQLLTAENWRRMMKGLDRHFGADASLDAAESAEILGFLEQNAARSPEHAAPSLRITDTPWFIREHRKVSGQVWSDSRVRSRANCIACHVTADRGDWSERSIRMPGGRGGH